MPINDNSDLDGLHDDGDDLIVDPVDPIPTPGDDNDPPAPVDDPPAKDSNTDDAPDLSGMEKFLADYGVIGGMITFEDGEQKHFDELSDVEKYNVVSSLVENSATPIEQKYGLDPAEIQLLNYFRTQEGKTIEESLDALLEQRMSQIELLNSANNTDYENMSQDALYLRWLKQNNPEATEEDLQEDLEKAKQLKSFEKSVDGIKKVFVEQQLAENQKAKLEQERLQQIELESDRRQIVETVSQIDSVAGFEVNDDEKNEILQSLLEVNEQGDSIFMEEIFSDPNKLFKAAWLYHKGEKMFDDMSDYYKRELSKQYKKGREEALQGTPSKPIVISNNSNKNTIAKRDEVNAKTQDELFDDED